MPHLNKSGETHVIVEVEHIQRDYMHIMFSGWTSGVNINVFLNIVEYNRVLQGEHIIHT